MWCWCLERRLLPRSTQRYDTLTFTRSSAEAEDVSLFDRKRRKNISVYPSQQTLARRGRSYDEDALAPYDVLDYDIDLTFSPDRLWFEARARLQLRVQASAINNITLRLASPLVVRSIVSDRFGRLFGVRVRDQNAVIVNLPSLQVKDDEFTLTIAYGGRLEPQREDAEAALLPQPPGQGPPGEEIQLLQPERSYLYSNRSYWYPQSTISDYATARIRLTVPIVYGCVASGEPAGPPEVVIGRNPLDARHVYVFNAKRPARYLSFIVSRFIRADQAQIAFGDAAAQPTGEAEGSAEPLPGLNLVIEANPRQTRQGKALLGRATDIMRYYQSLVGDSPYPSFTIALVENALPGGHSPAYFAQLNQPRPNAP